MILTKSALELTNYLHLLRSSDQSVTVGFVPTMGALHQGHMTLVNKSVQENDISICSVFVNPTQFGEKSDLVNYPKPIEKDIELLMQAKNKILFLPEVDEMYPKSYEQQNFDLQNLDFKIEGKQRPGHFQGVCNVLYRFFQIIEPTRAYFGQKDFQQTVVVKRLVQLMGIDTSIDVVPIAREEHGLAMSSRNIRLSQQARKEADFLYKNLLQIKSGYKLLGLKAAISAAKQRIAQIPEAETEYLLAVDAGSLEEVENEAESEQIVLLAVVKFHGVRLLDNMYL